MIIQETAIVYWGGRRRWFSIKAAANAEANAKIKSRCSCESEDHGEFGIEHMSCWYHDPDNYDTIKRRLARMYIKAFEEL